MKYLDDAERYAQNIKYFVERGAARGQIVTEILDLQYALDNLRRELAPKLVEGEKLL